MPLVGMSHGGSGVALALYSQGVALGDKKYKNLAQSAIVYENDLFSKYGYWPDFRRGNSSAKTKPLLNTWSHGAAGVGLARLKMSSIIFGTNIENETRQAIQNTLDYGLDNNHSLISGNLGHFELPNQAANHCHDIKLKKRVKKIFNAILSDLAENNWRCGEPLGLVTPGLMFGISGIGYALLRQAFNNQIPSVLTLDKPKVCEL